MSEIAALRLRLGYTQRRLSELLGVHPLTVSRWERGTLTPTPDAARMISAIEQALALDPERLPVRLRSIADPVRELAAILSVLHPDLAAEAVVSRADAEALLAQASAARG
jgi:transcriptional regulator with XRE-family HTH domain